MIFLPQISFTKKSIDKREALKFAIILNVIMITVAFLIFRPRFESNDDVAMANLASGAYSEKTSYLVFVNFILGWIFKLFYMACDSINWYYVLQCLFMLVAFIVLSYLVYMAQSKAKYPVAQGTILNIFLLVLFIPTTYLYFNFTKSAAVISLAGFFLLLHYVADEKRKFPVLLFGVFLVILGGMIRLESMLMVSIFPFFIVIFRIFTISKKRLSINFSMFLRYAALFLPIFLISFSLSYLNTMRNPEYNAYNHARSQLLDYGLPAYDSNQKEFEKIGIDKNDYAMLQSWTFDDPDFFTIEKFKEIIAIRKNKFNILQVFENTLNSIAKSIFTIESAAFFVLMVSIWLFFFKKDRFIPLSMVFTVLAVYIYLSFMGRVINRVEQSLWLAAVYTLVLNFHFSINNIRIVSKKKMIVATFIVALLWNGNSIWENCIATTEKIHETKGFQVADRLSKDKNNFYLIDTYMAGFIQGYVSPFRTFKENFYSNIYALGGWTTRLPLNNEALDKYGITNPLKDSANRSNVYFVDNGNFIYKYNYIREHYYPDLTYVATKDLGICQVYKLYHPNDKVISNKLVNINKKRIHFDHLKKIKDQEILHLYGRVNVDGIDTFEQEIFVKAKNLKNGKEKIYQATTYVDDNNREGYNMMSKNVLDNFKLDIPNNEISSNMEYQIILKYHNQDYNIRTLH